LHACADDERASEPVRSGSPDAGQPAAATQAQDLFRASTHLRPIAFQRNQALDLVRPYSSAIHLFGGQIADVARYRERIGYRHIAVGAARTEAILTPGRLRHSRRNKDIALTMRRGPCR
jgi:hypothetical protein